MNITVQKDLKDSKAQAVILFGAKKEPSTILEFLNEDVHEKIKNIYKAEDFVGGDGDVLYLPKGMLLESSVLLVGLGEVEDFTIHQLHKAMGVASKSAQGKKLISLAFCVPQFMTDTLKEKAVLHVIIDAISAQYQFNSYITDEDKKAKNFTDVEVITSIDANDAVIEKGKAIADGVNYTKQLGNMPPIDMNPVFLGEEAKKLGDQYDAMTVKVLGDEEIKKEGMGGLMGVSLGSSDPAQFIIMEWKNNPKSKDTYVFVGKAITFDSGGISIKPSDKMDEMKFDMLGGGAVFGAMKAIAELDLPVNVVGLVPSTENKLGEKAYRPGDILKARNGKTVEVLNTDAEGRLILMDALSYAQDYKPAFVVDLATLTGACVVALGENYAGIFSRDENNLNVVKSASEQAGEKVWPLPIDDDFAEEMKSKIADLRNLGKGRYGGASSAAAFLENFVDYPWVHIDIAGVAWGDDKPFRYIGATGFGVQTLVELAQKWSRG